MKACAARELKQVFVFRVVVCTLVVLVGSVAVSHSRGGGGGGGGYARGGAASTGSFSGGAVAAGQREHPVAAAAVTARAVDNRQDNIDIGHRDHPVAAGAVAARAVDNRRDYYGGGGGAVYVELPCSSSETYVDGVTYYACGTTYYVQSYSGGSIVYVPSPPPGY